MKKITLITASILAASFSSASAATVTLAATGTANVYDIFEDVNNTNVGTVTLSGSIAASSATLTTDTGTQGSDSITWGATSGVTTFTFSFTGGWMVETAEFGTADGLGNIGENTSRQRPVGYAANFSGTVVDYAGGLTLTMNSTVANGGSLIGATPVAYAAGDYVVNGGFEAVTSSDEYLIASGTLNTTAPLTFTYGLSNGGGDTDAARLSFTVVPEPSGAMLLVLGVLGLLGKRRRV